MRRLAILMVLSMLIGCGKQVGSVSAPKDRVGAINDANQGSVNYAQAQINLRNNEPYIISDSLQINPSPLVKGFSNINADQTRSFTVGSPSDPNKFYMEDVDCKNYSLRIKHLSDPSKDVWFDAEADKVSGQIAYVVCHLPSSQY